MADLITGTNVQPINTGAASGFANSDNPHVRALAGEQIRPTEYYVGVYSVNKRQMAESKYSFIVENSALKTIAIPSCPANERYIKVMAIAHPVQAIEADPHAFNETIVRVTSAKRVAMSIVHPDIISESMDNLPAQSQLAMHAISSNCDLIKQGVFFTTADEGSTEFLRMLSAAEQRRDSYYRSLLSGVAGMSDREIQNFMSGDKGLDLRTASQHFGEEIPGMRMRTAPKVDCPNCFDKIPVGAAFHRNELLGVICVIDWQRAVEAGVKTLDQVPPTKRWWDEDEFVDEGESASQQVSESAGQQGSAPAAQVRPGRGRPVGSKGKPKRSGA